MFCIVSQDSINISNKCASDVSMHYENGGCCLRQKTINQKMMELGIKLFVSHLSYYKSRLHLRDDQNSPSSTCKRVVKIAHSVST